MLILIGLIFTGISIGFWQLGKTDLAKAYVIPVLVAGSLLLIIGLGLTITNKARINQFKNDFNRDAPAFITSEVSRDEAALKAYSTVVFKAIPLIIAVCPLILIFIDTSVWRASMITTITMMAVILLIDGTAHARIEAYYKQLIIEQSTSGLIDS